MPRSTGGAPRPPAAADMTGARPGGSIAAVSRTALALLRLLAQDAPAEQLEAQAAALVPDDPETGALARELALRVRSGIDGHRKREAELAALVETARDLA